MAQLDQETKQQEENSLSTVYNPQSVEGRIYEFWEEGGFFKADPDSKKPPFSMVLPPPNVTGSLHLGHAWDNTLQDIIVRFKRMSGFDAVWVPGTDHAGIATQARVEKAIRETEGKTRHQLGRTEFVKRVWDWKNEYGHTITTQIRALGGSCDWSRERFTMDDGLSRAVREVFVRLYDKGLIYRGHRIINWCPRCSTALSDIEVEHVDVEGTLYHVRYPFSDGVGEVVVATTRPETMFGDVAVAVHPDDERYQSFIGRTLALPFTDRQIPVIADEYVDREYGTGCVKITPAHDPNDFEVGERHHLDQPSCINLDGTMNSLAGRYQGLTREEARRQLVEDLRGSAYLIQEEPLTHAVGHCSRCQTVVEPFLSDQWFVRMEPLAKPTLEAVRSGQLRFVPERFEKVFVNWMESVRDWCISRQLWWGHRIPAWYCDDCGEITVSRDNVTECSHCRSKSVSQDEDVLDTWFSSALWPFSTMGWPEETPDFKRYFPTSVLATGYDILFFWVARMVFMGIEFTGKVPFRDVVLHGLIRAADGRKMSKSLGNGVDPLDVIGQYGADALRFTIANGTSPGNDQRFSFERVESSRNFINKIWNASRFVLMNIPADFVPFNLSKVPLGITDEWILTRYAETAREVTNHLERYDFGEAGRALYDFAWDEFCDWYIEFSKLALYGDDEQAKHTTQTVLVTVLGGLLRLLHPIIPFVTEEIWQAQHGTDASISVAPWPDAKTMPTYPESVSKVQLLMEAIRAVRNIRAERNVAPGKPIDLYVRARDEDSLRLFHSTESYLRRFCTAQTLTIAVGMEAPATAVTAVVSAGELFVPLESLVDLAQERDRLTKERDRLIQEVDRVEKKLNNANFVARAPEAVVVAEREKGKDYAMKLFAVNERLKALLNE